MPKHSTSMDRNIIDLNIGGTENVRPWKVTGKLKQKDDILF